MMKNSFKILIVVIFIFLLSGYFSLLEAKDKGLVELTDIRIRKLNETTNIDINTSNPVKFLYYKLDNPPRLVIDFISSNILSQEPEKIVFRRGNIREIQSVFYETSDKNIPAKLDLLIFKFAPNVTVRIESKKKGIVLKVGETIAISKRDDPDNLKLIVANILAQKIARRKRLAFKEDKKVIAGIKKFEAEGKIDEERILDSDEENVSLVSMFYLSNLYDVSIKDKLHTFLSRQLKEEDEKKLVDAYTPPAAEIKEINRKPEIVALTTESKLKNSFNWAALTGIIAAIGSGLLITAVSLKIRKFIKESNKEHHILPSLDEILGFKTEKKLLDNKVIEKKTIIPENRIDKFFEKRKLARFNLPYDDILTVFLDLETEGLNKISARARNLSLGGIGVEIDKNIKIPDILQVGLRLPDSQEVNQALARISWSKEKDSNLRYYGLSFMMLSDYETKKIKKFLSDNF